MVSQIIKQLVVAVAFVGAVGTVSAATATSTVTGVAGTASYTFWDLSTSTSIAIADLTFTYDANRNVTKLFFTFLEESKQDALSTNATFLTVHYKNNGSGSPSPQTYELSSAINDTVSDQLGGNGATFNYATLTYTHTPVTNVPEPESYAMLLAGLGLMGTIALRRNKNRKG